MSSRKHPVLSMGNFIEGVLGTLAISAAVISIIQFGFTAALLISLFYTAGVTIIALMSAYYLMV